MVALNVYIYTFTCTICYRCLKREQLHHRRLLVSQLAAVGPSDRLRGVREEISTNRLTLRSKEEGRYRLLLFDEFYRGIATMNPLSGHEWYNVFRILCLQPDAVILICPTNAIMAQELHRLNSIRHPISQSPSSRYNGLISLIGATITHHSKKSLSSSSAVIRFTTDSGQTVQLSLGKDQPSSSSNFSIHSTTKISKFNPMLPNSRFVMGSNLPFSRLDIQDNVTNFSCTVFDLS